jgi:hypothetical protein
MREQLEQRVRELKAEQHKGQQMLAELEGRQAELRQTLLRISGAIQVLEEMLAGPAVQNGALSPNEAVPRNGPVDARA